jgi:hypothetical protein
MIAVARKDSRRERGVLLAAVEAATRKLAVVHLLFDFRVLQML